MANMINKMPLLFVGHGSPMNVIEDNVFSRNWSKIAGEIPKPEAILAVSAHWYTNGSRIMDEENPKVVYDFYGFPKELYEIQYNAKGSPKLAHYTKKLICREVKIDNSWGYDHGTWSVLCRMYPKAEIPLYQLSVDKNASAAIHFQIGQEISSLREKGVLIFASGNVVHNLSKLNWDMAGGYSWAVEFDNYIKEKIQNREYRDVIQYEKAGASAGSAFITPDHFYPLLYFLGAAKENDRLTIFNDTCTLGSLSMTSYLLE